MLGLDIVTIGWELAGWDGTFYPEDLPHDWRLTYFANEFPAVIVPSGHWMQADTSQVSAWVEDVHDGFRFYLAGPGTRATPGNLDRARRILGAKLAGLVCEKGARDWPPGPVSCFQLMGEPEGLPAAGCLPAWRIPAVQIGDLRAARTLLENLAARVPGGRALLVLAGEDIDVDDLRRWWSLAWLMGVAA